MLRVRERLRRAAVCDRVGAGDDRIRFTSAILPPMSASTIALMKGGLGRGACPSAQARSVEQALRRHLARGWPCTARESTQSWRELLLDLKRPGCRVATKRSLRPTCLL